MSIGPRKLSSAVPIISLLALAMVTATYLPGALSVLSVHVLEDLGISRTQLGLTFAAFSMTSAVTAPSIGGLADRSVRSIMIALFATGALGIVMASLAESYWMMMAAAVVSGLALGAGNPVTNRVVSLRIPHRSRGLAVGIKQSGPPLGLLVAGVTLGPLAAAVGWRPALALTAVMPVAGLVVVRRLLPARGGATEEGSETPMEPSEPGPTVLRLSVLSLGTALGLSAVTAFVPLYGHEVVGMSSSTAGLVAGAMGLTGVTARIMWTALRKRLPGNFTTLLVISILSIVAAAALRSAEWLGGAGLWAGALLAGASMFAWHAVAWVLIIDTTHSTRVGRASGLMQVGTSIGFAGGPPLMGMLIDADPSYATGWSATIALFVLVTVATAGTASWRNPSPG
jgi:predicted MFS family arabinose efflux permease